ncbi:MAG: response regulator [Flavobacteriales bacterium]|nr:response regulator [Flavobacteriales bacterium]
MKAKTVNKEIFLVDDDPMCLEVLKYQLHELKGYKISVFQSAEECLKQIHRKPEFIILDFNLDGMIETNMDGHQALGLIHNYNKNIEVIFISGEHNFELLEVYEKFRSVEFLVKEGFGSPIIKDYIESRIQSKYPKYIA